MLRTSLLRPQRVATRLLLWLFIVGSPLPARAAESTEREPDATAPPVVNRVMGIGEARKPEPFTREQRFLHAVRQDDQATVRRALELGVPIETLDDLDRSAALLAVRDAGSLDLLKLLHQNGAILDQPDLGGRTALSYAAARGRTDLIQFLIAGGADVNAADDIQKTPVFYARNGNHPKAIRLLAEHGANLNARERFQKTPLIVACEKDADAAARVLWR